MQITLNEVEILSALETYVRSQITVAEDQKIVFDLKAGRGDNGFSATLDIMSSDTPVTAKPKTAAPKPFAKPKAVEATPEKVESDEVDTSDELEVDEGPTEDLDEESADTDETVEETPAKSKVSIFGKSA